jgi:MoxR-like ATPase
VALVQATRKNRTGVSPRGTLALLRAAQGYALVNERDYVVPEDIKSVAHYVLCHRLIGDIDNVEKSSVVTAILNSTPLPTEDWIKR